MAERQTAAPVTIQELFISTLAQSDALAKLFIDKGIITQQELMAKLSAERRFAKGFWCCGKNGRKSTVELKTRYS